MNNIFFPDLDGRGVLIKKKKLYLYLSLSAIPVYLYISSGSRNPAEFLKQYVPIGDPLFLVKMLGLLGFGAFFFLIFYLVMGYIAAKFFVWDQALRETAMELGLKYSNHILGNNFTIDNNINSSAIKKIFHSKALTFSLHIRDIKIEGMYKGVFISISFEEEGDDGKNNIMVLRANFPTSLSMGLSIVPVGSATRFIDWFTNRDNEKSDNLKNIIKITVSGVKNNSSEIQSIPSLEKVKKLYKSFPHTFIDDERIISKRLVLIHIDKPPVFKNLLTMLAGAALAIHKAIPR